MAGFSRLRSTLKDPEDEKKHYGLPANLEQMSRREQRKVLFREIEISADGKAGLGKDVDIIDRLYRSMKFEIVTTGVDYRDVNAVLSFTEARRALFLKIYNENREELSKEQRFHLCNMIKFLRRLQERADDYMFTVLRYAQAHGYP